MRSALVCLWLLWAGCGYRFTAPGANLPAGAGPIRVPVFENQATEPNFEVLVTQAIRERYARAGLLGGDGAETTLEGSVLSVSSGPVFGGVAFPTYQVAASVRVTLRRGDQVLGQAIVSTTEDFTSGGDVLLTEANRGAALRRLADVVSREVVERLEK
jgi:hypothetical protein